MIIFEARGSHDVHVLFSLCDENDGCNGFEIVLGGWGNQLSIIRGYKQEGSPTDSGLLTEVFTKTSYKFVILISRHQIS